MPSEALLLKVIKVWVPGTSYKLSYTVVLARLKGGQINSFNPLPPPFFLTAQLTAPASLLTTEK